MGGRQNALFSERSQLIAATAQSDTRIGAVFLPLVKVDRPPFVSRTPLAARLRRARAATTLTRAGSAAALPLGGA
jgi:hypothetical protein